MFWCLLSVEQLGIVTSKGREGQMQKSGSMRIDEDPFCWCSGDIYRERNPNNNVRDHQVLISQWLWIKYFAGSGAGDMRPRDFPGIWARLSRGHFPRDYLKHLPATYYDFIHSIPGHC